MRTDFIRLAARMMMQAVLSVLGIVLGAPAAAPGAEIHFQQVVLDNSYIAYERDVGDMDGDGLNDVAAVMEGDTTVQVFRAPTWRRATLIPFAGEYRYPRADDFKLADVDRDGDLDVITRLGKGPSDDGPGIAVWCESLDGGSTFTQHLIGNSLEYVKDIVVADFDRDGRPDVAMRMDSRTQLWLQETGKTWTEVRLTHPPHEGMEAGDLDMDGDPDLVFNGYWFETPNTAAAARVAANYTYHVVDAAWFNQTGDWTKNSCKVVVGDFDGDGRNDVAFSHSERAGHAITWYGSATPRVDGAWSKHSVAVVDFCHTLQAADFDLDGDVDLLAGGMIQSQHRGLRLLRNGGGGTNWTQLVIQTDGSYSAELGDIDNDGDPDIVGIRNWNAAPTWIYRNAGAPRKARSSQAEAAPLPAAPPTRLHGPLRVHPANPRYFTDGTQSPDGSLKAVYLTGSHTWLNLQDGNTTGGVGHPTHNSALGNPLSPFDYGAYLDFLQEHHHNFIRLWAWEGSGWVRPNTERVTLSPLPFARTGPGQALDGKPKFDLTKFNPAYFDRLRERVVAARERGFYVGIMLFQGFSVARKSNQRKDTPWTGHPLHAGNNVNGLDGDANGDGEGYEVHTLGHPAVTRVQEAYVRKVIDTVNDLDNVLYEISNESHGASASWQYHMIDFIHRYEQTKPRQHPVWMSFCWDGVAGPGTMADLLAGGAEAVSPPGNDKGHKAPKRYIEDPPADDAKVVISDTDHLWGIGGNHAWVWKSFTRGLYPIFMDTYRHSPFVPGPDLDPQWNEVRQAMGVTRRLAARMNLAAMTPHNELASTAYCLADPGKEYLVYLPKGGEVTVDLSAARGELRVEWVRPVEGTITGAEPVAGGGRRTLKAPFGGEAVVHLRTSARAEADGAIRAAPYLAAVRQFADQVLAHGRDTYGKPTPLFVDGVNVDTLEPVKWKWADGKEWVLCNLTSQQGLFRTLDGLSRLTGEPRYKDAALEALRYAFDQLRYGTEHNGGLLAWGGHLVYNATDDVITGQPKGTGRIHELKCFFPHYDLMWEANPRATRQLIENMWNCHVLDWANLDFNRHANPKKLGALWQNEYRGGEVFFDGQGLTFHNAGSDFYFAAGMLSKLAGTPEPLVWAKRLAHRYVETRDPKTGLGGYQFSQCRSAWCDDVGKIRGDRAQYQYGDDFKGHRVVEGTLFPCYGDTPEVEPQVGRLLLGDQLGDAGRDFTRWVVEELTAWGKSAYRKQDNAFIPMLTDGTSMEGYVCKKDGYFGPKGRVLRAGHPGSAHLWLYAWAFRLSREPFLWEMARNIVQGNGWGDLGATAEAGPALRFPAGSSDPRLLMALLELHRAGGNDLFLAQAEATGRNILRQRVRDGWFVPSRRHLYCRLANDEAQALLHLAAALRGKPQAVPVFTGASGFFHAEYGGRTGREYDSQIFYRQTRQP